MLKYKARLLSSTDNMERVFVRVDKDVSHHDVSQVTGPMIGVPNRAITEEYNCLRLDHCKGCAVTYTHGEGHCGLHKVNFSILQKLCIYVRQH